MTTDESETSTVHCAKLDEELPAMIYQPFQGPLGERILRNISQRAWDLWLEHSKMLVNEYRLDLTSDKAHNTLKEQCTEFLFGEGESAQALPPDFVPTETDTASTSTSDDS